ncbi:hypothetical protein [Photobacterium chitinilyticum]|uniref:hypothetical protein n=1 Tax=Photobacterium chitinilyticum TaxID=2485123 RepID=UPI001F1E7064|nr:hypothetical protein [Photobacterium chitinilyticum]
MHLSYQGKDLLSERMWAFGALVSVLTFCGAHVLSAFIAAIIAVAFLSMLA